MKALSSRARSGTTEETGVGPRMSSIARFTASFSSPLSLVKVNMTATCDNTSSLPQGLVARDFPPTLSTVLTAGTPFGKFPPDLHEIWPRGMDFLLMENGFVALPDVLLRMEPVRLNLQYNNLEHLPATLFELHSLELLDIGWNPIQELPQQVDPSPALLELNFEATNVSTLPKWTKTESFLSRVRLAAPMTPLCARLQADTAPINAESTALAHGICAPRKLLKDVVP